MPKIQVFAVANLLLTIAIQKTDVRAQDFRVSLFVFALISCWQAAYQIQCLAKKMGSLRLTIYSLFCA